VSGGSSGQAGASDMGGNGGSMETAGAAGIVNVAGASGSEGARPGVVGRWVDLGVADGNIGPGGALVKLRDGSVLVIGELPGVQRFLPETNTFEMAAPLPDDQTRTEFATVVLENGHVLVIGGNVNQVRDGTTSVLDYDPEADSWSSAADQPAARYSQAAIALSGGKVLVAGGISAGLGGISAADVFRYDVSTDEWETLAPLPQTSRYPTLFATDEVSVLVADAIPQVYDHSVQAVSLNPFHPTYREEAPSVQLASRSVLTIGGTDRDDIVVPTLDEYVPGSSTWVARAGLGTPRQASAAVTLSDGTVLVVSGSSSSDTIANDPAPMSAERYLPSRDEWLEEAPLLIPTGVSGVLLDDGSVLFFSEPARFYPERWQ
jgi:hypothetical protein